MRRLLRVDDGMRSSVSAAESLFGKSIAVSTVRCLLTYVLLPVLRPVLDLTGGVGPMVGLVVTAVSVVAITIAMRRFWAADHRMRWAYTAVASGIIVLLAFQVVGDIRALLS